MKNYIEFGLLKGSRKNIYENISYDQIEQTYDVFMMGRYFRDIKVLSKEKKLENLFKSLHHKKDIYFSFVSYILGLTSSSTHYYEFGCTLFERFFFFQFFDNFLRKKLNKQLKYYGNDKSDTFNFFCNNFLDKKKFKSFRNFNKSYLRNSLFFSKGVSLLYERSNKNKIEQILKLSNSGSFDFSISDKNETKILNTGLHLHYMSKNEFKKILLKNHSKIFLFKNLKKNNRHTYFEIIYGDKEKIFKFSKLYEKYRLRFKNTKKYITLNLGSKFLDLETFLKKIS